MNEEQAPEGGFTLTNLRERIKTTPGKEKRIVTINAKEWIPGLLFRFEEPGPVDAFQAAEIAAEMRIEKPHLAQGMCNVIALLALQCRYPTTGSDKDRLPFFIDLADADQAKKEGFEGLFGFLSREFSAAFPKSRGASVDQEIEEAKND